MTKNHFSLPGIILVAIYLILFGFAVLEDVGTSPEPMSGFAFLILTAPWSFALMLLLEYLNILTAENGDALLPVLVIFGALVNSFILYFAGHFVAKIVGHFNRKPEKTAR